MKISLLAGGIAYSNDLAEQIIDKNINSEIVKEQQEADYNIFTKEKFQDEDGKTNMLWVLGGTKIPAAAILYPTSFDNKDELIQYLDKYNEGKIMMIK